MHICLEKIRGILLRASATCSVRVTESAISGQEDASEHYPSKKFLPTLVVGVDSGSLE